jgi:hypothetical protein
MNINLAIASASHASMNLAASHHCYWATAPPQLLLALLFCHPPLSHLSCIVCHCLSCPPWQAALAEFPTSIAPYLATSTPTLLRCWTAIDHRCLRHVLHYSRRWLKCVRLDIARISYLSLDVIDPFVAWYFDIDSRYFQNIVSIFENKCIIWCFLLLLLKQHPVCSIICRGPNWTPRRYLPATSWAWQKWPANSLEALKSRELRAL